MHNEKITIDIEAIRKMPNGSVTDAETIRQIGLHCVQNRDIELADKIDGRFTVAGLYPYVQKSYNILPNTPKSYSKEHILSELGITGDVLAIFPYGSQVYGTATENSDRDYIIVMKGAMLDSGAFRDNAISNEDWSIQGVVYSRGGFIDAINNYEIGALECLSLDPSQVLVSKWPFKIGTWNEVEMVKKIIRKASASRHIADMQSKSGDKVYAIKGTFHALRILRFGLQLKEHRKIVDFQACNEMYAEFMKIIPEEFDSRDYFNTFDNLLIELRE